MTTLNLPESIDGPPSNHPCAQRLGATQPTGVDNERILRITGDNFYLRALDEELEYLSHAKIQTRRALEKTLRASIIAGSEWPHSVSGRCAILLWLLDNPNAEHGKFHHLYEKVPRPGSPLKPTGALIRAGIGSAGIAI